MRIEFIDFKEGVVIDGETEIVYLDGKPMTYKEFESDYNRVRICHEFVRDRPEVYGIFNKMSAEGIIGVVDQFRQFKRCNLDSLDEKIDIDTDLGYFNPEYVHKCGHKGANKNCPFAKVEGDRKPYCLIKNKYQIPVR